VQFGPDATSLAPQIRKSPLRPAPRNLDAAFTQRRLACSPRIDVEEASMDLVYIGAVLALAGLTAGLIAVCDRLLVANRDRS